ncbi:transglutaminase-like domain-containing protein [Paenibacillus contaminans]|uniref:Transglutaminase domain-containing protein n=1 Tax=Paenibacillus contaminans TaxID=450362 RepID=A0A329MAX4_9BACL|nr:transglutaminase-like domain-containing protein [Paenibacillus contaminans]RAV17329.1 transglutaminase domain-containing protein [Paenibacillus contaminans]
MFPKRRIILIVLAIFLLALPNAAFAAPAKAAVDKDLLDQGIVTVDYAIGKNAKAIVRVVKGKVHYDYNLVEGAQYPLQLGDGKYTILIAEAVGGTKYKVVAQEEVVLEMEDANAVFLQTIPPIDWNEETLAVVKAAELTEDLETDEEKLAAIYQYITETIEYDYELAATVEPGYIPNLDEVFEAEKGICYDYAATFAAMARSVGLPTKLVMGYQMDDPDTYHAWNEVYLEETDEWVTIDTTYDAAAVQNGEAAEMIKDAADYTVAKFY